jgi:hypothetical protein
MIPNNERLPNCRISIFEALRGIAAISVATSGFVIPLSLHGPGHQLCHFPNFMLRRLLRFEPPYLASIAMVIVLGYLSSLAPGFHGGP